MGNVTCPVPSFPSILSFLSAAPAEQVLSSPGELTWHGSGQVTQEVCGGGALGAQWPLSREYT